MSCRIDVAEIVVVISPSTHSVFTTTAEHIASVKRKPDGHYDRADMMTLVKAGHAVHHDEKVVRAIMRASEFLIFGCPSV
jgi:hypothetical protein